MFLYFALFVYVFVLLTILYIGITRMDHIEILFPGEGPVLLFLTAIIWPLLVAYNLYRYVKGEIR